MSLDGQFDLRNWEPTPKNARIRQSRAPNRLRVGGTGSSKSSDALMEAIQSYPPPGGRGARLAPLSPWTAF